MEPRITNNYPIRHPSLNQHSLKIITNRIFRGPSEEKWRRKRGSRGGRHLHPKEKKEDIGERGIINLWTKELSREELVTLSKGLKFTPPQNINMFQTFIDIQKYTRKRNIKRYLLTNPTRQLAKDASAIAHSGLSNALLFNPPGNVAPNINVFCDLVIKDLKQSHQDINTKHVLNTLDTVEWKSTYLLITTDVASLYMAISHQLRHDAV